MIFTHSRFYFNFEVDSTNNAIDFDEGGGELQATVATGSYTMTDFATALQNALNTAGGQTYTVTVNRTTRIFTISATSGFSLLVSTGSRAGSSAYGTAGFTGADRTSATSHDGDTAAGSEYTTQFKLQSFVDPEDNQEAADATVNQSASGQVEVVKFGTNKFMQCNFVLITNETQPTGSPIRNRPTGKADFRTFMEFLVTKAPIEFMADEDDPGTFTKLILESTPESREGVGFRLKERFAQGLTNYYDSGILRFRVQT